MADAQNSTQADSSIISKITVASIGCKPGEVNAKENEGITELPLARLYGTLDAAKPQVDVASGRTDIVFVGNFEAINMQTGEVFKSGKMYLPKGLSELVEGEVNKNPGTAIAFAFELRSIKANNPAKYSYKALPLVSPEKSDALSALRERVLKAGSITAKTLTTSQRGTGPTTIDGDAGKAAAGAKKSA